MEVLEKTITYKQSDGDWYLYPLGDMHIGTKHCAEERLRKTIEEIKNCPTALWIGMGDYGEFISPNDYRWDYKIISDWLRDDQDNIAEAQIEHIAELLIPIQDKCIGLIEGNHEEAHRRYNHVDIQKNLCKRLDVPNLGYSAWIKLRFARQNSNEHHVYKIVATHGNGSAITAGAKMLRLQRFVNSFDARIFLHGHLHDIITHTMPLPELSESNRIREKLRVGAVTGCWVKAYTQGVSASYAERKGYPPTSLGCPIIVINPTHDIVKISG